MGHVRRSNGKTRVVFEYTLPEGRPVRSVEIQDGDRFHPGGLMADGDSLWIPVAEYRKDSTATIQKRSKQNLRVGVPVQGRRSHRSGRSHTRWNRGRQLGRSLPLRLGSEWRQIRKIANQSGVAFQDLKFDDGELVGSGLLKDKSGVIVWMDWPSLRVNRRVAVGRTDRGVAYTHEGMAIRKQTLWLLPEDSNSRLFIFSLAR